MTMVITPEAIRQIAEGLGFDLPIILSRLDAL